MSLATMILLALLPQLVDRTKEPLRPEPPREGLSAEQRGDVYMARKMYREGVETYELASRRKPSARLYNKIGIGYHHLGRFSQARRNYQRAVKFNGAYGSAINNLGALHYAQRRYKKAIRQYRKALGAAPSSASIHSNLGTAYFARKKYKKAAAEYQRALKLDPLVFERRATTGTLLQERSVRNRARFFFFMARSYAVAGVMDKCLLYLRKAFEEGYKKRKKVADDPVFAPLREDPVFRRLVFGEQTARLNNRNPQRPNRGRPRP